MRLSHFFPSLTVLLSLLLSVSFIPMLNAAVVAENGSLQGFFSGVAQGCAYDNWISHTSEADQVNDPNNFSPPELDRETNGFGAYQVVDSLPNPDAVLADWNAIFRYLIQGDAAAADTRLANSWMQGRYQVVRLTDGGQAYLMLREVLNNQYFDNNGTPNDQRDDVTGSFDLGWGLFVVRLGAGNPQVVIEVVHPSTDFTAPHIAFDAFNTLGAGCLFVSGASRNIAWSGPTYSESVSLSDPSRNARTPYQEAHKAAVDLLGNEWVLQIHSYNPYPAHDGVPSVQVSAERENKTDVNLPLMGWNHFDVISLTPNPPVTRNQNLWPFSEPQIDDYYTVYYPGHYHWRGEIPIPNNVDLPGTISNCQMVYTHIGHDFVNHPENWTHLEFDEYPDVVRLDSVSMLNFYRYGELGPRVPTYENFRFAVHYYHPVFVAAAQYLAGPPAPVQASVINENAPLIEFYQGSTRAAAYDNWVSHIVEGIATAGYNDYGPAQLDRQTNGFGNFQRVPNGTPGDNLLTGWRQVFDAFVAGNAAATATALTNAGLGGMYQVVRLTDGGEEYLILREVLNNNYADDNGTAGNAADDVVGSFNYGWGLYVRNLTASRPEVVLEVPHPCDDYIAHANAMDAFRTIDAGMLFVAGAGREVAWTDVAPFANSKSLSDPTRNARHPFHIAHKAAVDAVGGELVIQVHSYDTGAHLSSKSVELSAYDDPTPNQPLMDRVNYFDLMSRTPEYPVAANTIGGSNHAAVRVSDYYSVHYPGGSYSWNGSIPMTTSVDQPGYSLNQQMLYSHVGHNQATDRENWIHFEQDEFPNVITESLLSFYGANGSAPTYQNYANSVEYYHPLYVAIANAINTSPIWTSVPASVTVEAGALIRFTVTGTDPNGDALTVTYQGGLPPAAGFTDGGNGSGELVWQTDQQSGGNYTASFRISDGFSFVNTTVPVTVTGGVSIAYATSEQTVAGTRTGSYANTLQSDNSYEVITERLSTGDNRYSYLEHIWTVPIEGAAMTLRVEAFHSANNEGDDFIIAGSFDGTTYANLITVIKTADNNAEQTVAIPGQTTGTYRLRVRDANRTGGRQVLDSFSADRIYITYTPLEAVMLVSDIAMTRVVNNRDISARAVVTIKSTINLPVSGAVVSATWSGLTSANVSGTTNASGQVTFNSARLRNPTGSFIIAVTNVTANGWTYNAGLNVETSDRLNVVNGQLAGREGRELSIGTSLPNEITLSSPYPNPFNNQTLVRIGLPEEGKVNLSVYDLHGRKVSSLLSQTIHAGWHVVEWTPYDVPNGEYLIRLETDWEAKVTRVLLVR